MSKFFSLAALVVAGIIVADIVTHGATVKNAMTGFSKVTTPSITALAGKG